MTPLANPGLDHLVLLAHTLEQGLDWCEQHLGLRPSAGGEHPLMGTHNRLLRIDSAGFPGAYFEVIAIQPGAPMARSAGCKRWYDLDSLALQAQLRAHGPQLGHWVARVPDAGAAVQALSQLDIDPGALLQASRMTPRGLLQWQITVRDDGVRLFDGVLPTLIQWGSVHPAESLPASGIALRSLRIAHPRASALRRACQALGLGQVEIGEGSCAIEAKLQTAQGLRTIGGTLGL